MMRTIGIRELKAHLSRTLRDVQRGERYLVTDRGRVVAELRLPGADLAANATPAEAVRLRMAASGELRVAERPRTRYERTGVALSQGTAKDLLDQVRGDR
jgi:antitoxin (DNA-binding transcriptional repressor) of toxin-antitoxin stability system